MSLGKWWEVVQCPPLLTVVAECIEAKRKANRRPAYVRELDRSLHHFAKGREQDDPRYISPDQIERFLEDFSPPTRATLMNRLGALFSFAQRRGYIEHNPVQRIDRIVLESRPPIILTPAQARLMFARCQPRMLGYLVLGMFCGLRAGELERLRWEDVDPRGVITIDAAASKVRRRRIIQMEPNAIEWLARVDRRFPIHPGWSKTYLLTRLAIKAGMESWSQNLLRHSAASYLLALHRDAGRVAHILGNSAGILLNRYAEIVTPEACKEFWAIRPL